MHPDRKRSPNSDPLGVLLEYGLVFLVATAPLPFGAVRPGGRAYLEWGAFVLLALWALRATVFPTPLPRRSIVVGCCGLLVLGLVQIAPLGSGIVGMVSPEASRLRLESAGPTDSLEAEQRLLGGVDPRSLDPVMSLSLDPERTASALRTGTALVAILFVATTVVAGRGAGRLAFGVCLAGAFQALYGTLVLASGYDMIWNVPKEHYLDSATGTFINRNHFASFVGAAAALGLGLALAASRALDRRSDRSRISIWTGRRGIRVIGLWGLVALCLIGLLLSFSRAGIAVGLGATAWVALRANRAPLSRRAMAVALLLGIAILPLYQIGAERLAERYGAAISDFGAEGGRGRVWLDTMGMAASFPLVGSGFGTFQEVYPAFRSGEVRKFFAHAHNDVLQAASEGGLVGLVLLLMILLPVGRSLLGALSGDAGALPVAVAAALTAVLAHAVVDFPFHIPANAALAAALAGAVEGLAARERA